MPQVVREDIDNLNVSLTVKIDKGDYEQQFRQELEKYRKQAHLKGFRKGKTPASVVRKFYGKPILGDILEKLLQKSLGDFITSENLEVLGYPIENPDHSLKDLETAELSDYEFKFDLGLAPAFELKGVAPEDTYELLVIDFPEEEITSELDQMARRQGSQTTVETDIEKNDIVRIQVRELADGAVREDGVSNEFDILISRLNEGARAEFLKHKKGDTLQIDIFDLEEGAAEAYVRKEFLGLDPEVELEVGRLFEAVIEEVKRFEKAEFNEEFFQKAFGEAVTTEEQARKLIRDDVEKYYRSQADVVFFRTCQDALVKANDFPLPIEFLQRWLKADMKDDVPADFDHHFYHFEENLRWTLIREKLLDLLQVEVTEAELLEIYKDRFRQYIQDETMLENLAQRFLDSDRQEGKTDVQEEALSRKIIAGIQDRCTVSEKKVTVDEFNEIRSELSGHHHHHDHDHHHHDEEE